MKTIADFKRRMATLPPVAVTVYYLKNGTYQVSIEYGIRTVSIIQSNQFAFKTLKPKDNNYADSWCAWPTKKTFVPIDDHTVEIHYPDGKMVFRFVSEEEMNKQSLVGTTDRLPLPGKRIPKAIGSY